MIYLLWLFASIIGCTSAVQLWLWGWDRLKQRRELDRQRLAQMKFWSVQMLIAYVEYRDAQQRDDIREMRRAYQRAVLADFRFWKEAENCTSSP